MFIEEAPSPTYLNRIDDRLRHIFKRILHLASSVSNGFVYARKRDGGLGLPTIGTLVPLALLRAGRKLSDLNDPLILNITKSDYFFQRMNTIIGSFRMTEASWPLTLQAINKMKLQLKIRESEDWSRCISQGRGAQEFYNDPIGNSWLYRPQFFKTGQYIEAIKLRTNTTGVRTILARCVSLRGSVECRKCLERPETQAHVLGICSHTKAPRIKRHDAIVGAMKDKLQTNDPGNIIYHEQTFTNLDGSNLRPDLVLVSHGMGQVIDITVRYEEGHAFEETFREKQAKYDGLREDLK